ncbi:molybdenum cofactor guanylyltransferase [Dactylosporangium sp. NPDC051541]|uniref:molybdenum cofactor guanylyltransferase n=1 Tax=Dactylosporangium sp. NPDC051541 TaxID=3363977 RepID=UPI0037935E74
MILAGGRAARLGGVDKPMVAVGGTPMLLRVLAAVDEVSASPVVVVGPHRDALPAGVVVVREEPAGGGPVAAAAAGVGGLGDQQGLVLLLASDLPHLSGAALRMLIDRVAGYDGALFVDAGGRRQLLCGVWEVQALRQAIRDFGETEGGALRRLVGGLRVAEVAWQGERAPYFDCDTQEDLRKVGP